MRSRASASSSQAVVTGGGLRGGERTRGGTPSGHGLSTPAAARSSRSRPAADTSGVVHRGKRSAPPPGPAQSRARFPPRRRPALPPPDHTSELLVSSPVTLAAPADVSRRSVLRAARRGGGDRGRRGRRHHRRSRAGPTACRPSRAGGDVPPARRAARCSSPAGRHLVGRFSYGHSARADPPGHRGRRPASLVREAARPGRGARRRRRRCAAWWPSLQYDRRHDLWKRNDGRRHGRLGGHGGLPALAARAAGAHQPPGARADDRVLDEPPQRARRTPTASSPGGSTTTEWSAATRSASSPTCWRPPPPTRRWGCTSATRCRRRSTRTRTSVASCSSCTRWVAATTPRTTSRAQPASSPATASTCGGPSTPVLPRRPLDRPGAGHGLHPRQRRRRWSRRHRAPTSGTWPPTRQTAQRIARKLAVKFVARRRPAGARRPARRRLPAQRHRDRAGAAGPGALPRVRRLGGREGPRPRRGRRRHLPRPRRGAAPSAQPEHRPRGPRDPVADRVRRRPPFSWPRPDGPPLDQRRLVRHPAGCSPRWSCTGR